MILEDFTYQHPVRFHYRKGTIINFPLEEWATVRYENLDNSEHSIPFEHLDLFRSYTEDWERILPEPPKITPTSITNVKDIRKDFLKDSVTIEPQEPSEEQKTKRKMLCPACGHTKGHYFMMFPTGVFSCNKCGSQMEILDEIPPENIADQEAHIEREDHPPKEDVSENPESE
jgi:hypothetical protein